MLAVAHEAAISYVCIIAQQSRAEQSNVCSLLPAACCLLHTHHARTYTRTHRHPRWLCTAVPCRADTAHACHITRCLCLPVCRAGAADVPIFCLHGNRQLRLLLPHGCVCVHRTCLMTPRAQQQREPVCVSLNVWCLLLGTPLNVPLTSSTSCCDVHSTTPRFCSAVAWRRNHRLLRMLLVCPKDLRRDQD
jgi:hypothetical protein